MKKILFILFTLTIFSFSHPIFSFGGMNLSHTTIKNIHTLGDVALTDVTTEDISLTGPLIFKNLTVSHGANILGPVEGIHGKFENLSITGPLKFEGLSVQDVASFTGNVSGKHGNFLDLTIVGSFTLDQTTCQNFTGLGVGRVSKLRVKGKTTLVGNLNAEESQFEDMTLTSEEIILNKTQAQNIFIKKNNENSFFSLSNDNKAQELHVIHNSIIEGSVTFESGKGTIFLGADSKIKGKVKGAVIKNT